jgi:hypothetical protein
MGGSSSKPETTADKVASKAEKVIHYLLINPPAANELCMPSFPTASPGCHATWRDRRLCLLPSHA